MKRIENIRIGKPDASPTLTAHTPGIRQGNALGNLDRAAGYYTSGNMVKGTARRSTGINPDARNPIDPNSPNLAPP